MDLQAFLSSTEGIALQAMLGLAFADFVLGVLAAVRDGTFELEAIAAFLRKHLVGRVLPIGLLLLGTYYFGGIDEALGLGGAALVAAAAYTAETASSLKSSILSAMAGPEKLPELAADNVADAQESIAILSNPIPEE
jgi:hypothetical protein